MINLEKKTLKSSTVVMVAFILFGLTAQTFASDIAELRSLSARQRALGNTRVAIPDPARALFTNPAGLSVYTKELKEVKVKKEAKQGPELSENEVSAGELEKGTTSNVAQEPTPQADPVISTKKQYEWVYKNSFLGPRFQGGISDGSLDHLDTFRDIQNSSDTAQKLTLIRSIIPAEGNVSAQGDIFHWGRKSFGLGLYSATEITGVVQRRSSPEMVLDVHTDVVFGVGFSKMFGDTAVGITPKFAQRLYLYDPANTSNPRQLFLDVDDVTEIANDSDSGKLDDLKFYSPSGILFDLGFLRPLDTKVGNGHWGATIYNAGGELSGELDGTTTTVKTKIPTEIVVGASLNTNSDHILLKDTLVLADVEIQGGVSTYEKRLHLGVERELFKSFNNMIARSLVVRLGINEGFIVGGLGIRLINFKNLSVLHINYAQYAEEFGTEIGHNTAKYQTLELGLLF